MNLTLTDIDNLLLALNSWEHEPSSGKLISGLMTAMLSRSSDECKRSLDKLDAEGNKDELSLRKEQVVRLKVKLFDLRDQLLGELVNSAHK